MIENIRLNHINNINLEEEDLLDEGMERKFIIATDHFTQYLWLIMNIQEQNFCLMKTHTKSFLSVILDELHTRMIQIHPTIIEMSDFYPTTILLHT